MSADQLTPDQRAQYHESGFVRLAGFADLDVCERMLARVVALARAHADGDRAAPGLVLRVRTRQRLRHRPQTTPSPHRDTPPITVTKGRP